MATHHTYDNVTPEELDLAQRYALEMEWSPEDDAFIASFPDAPGVKTHGATRVEAAEMAEDAIITWLTAMIDAGRPVPPPSPYSGRETDEHPPVFNADHIREIRRNFNVSQETFAELLNVSLATVRAWEQGARTPDGAATRLLSIAEQHPETILAAASVTRNRPRMTVARAS
jgi:DNA-binding transcriptional regulator YiaG